MHFRALEWIERFCRHLVLERRVSPHTHSNYRRDLEALVTFCDRAGVEDWAAMDVKQVRAFAARSRARGLGSASIQRRLSAVRTFMAFLMRENVLTYNVAKDVTGPKVTRPLPQVLSVDQMTALIERPRRRDSGDRFFARDRAIMELFYSSGLRLAELVGLDVGDLDLQDRAVRVLGKGSRERIVPVGRMAIEALTRYLRERKPKPGEAALFLARGGRRIQRRAVQTRVAAWAKRAGIQQHVYPHLFRHACATHVLESSGSIRDVQELLGHASISTTAIYTHLDTQYLLTAYMAAHPRAKRVTEPGKPQPMPSADPPSLESP